MNSTPASPTTPKILVVEDDPSTQKLISSLLGKSNIVPVIAPSAEEALKAIEKESFDIILLDINLPGISGIEFSKTIRSKETGSNRHQLIIALTASEDDNIRQQCRDCGMDGFLAKPIGREKLLGLIKRIKL